LYGEEKFRPLNYTEFKTAIEEECMFKDQLCIYAMKIGIEEDYQLLMRKLDRKQFEETLIGIKKGDEIDSIEFNRFKSKKASAKSKKASAKKVTIELSFKEFVGVVYYAYTNGIKDIQFPFYSRNNQYCLFTRE
jgi:negative regulator of genetic competence, sporulation and motility